MIPEVILKKFISIFMLIGAVLLLSCESSQMLKTDDARTKYADSNLDDVKKDKNIYGTVYDAVTKNPVPDAVIEIKNMNMGVGYYKVKTDRKGRYKVEDFIPHINYIMEVTAEGYVSSSVSGVIRPGERNVYIDPETIVSGKIKGTDGRGISGVEVRITQSSNYYKRIKPKIMKTNSSGNYSFNKLPYGRYIVTVNKAGYIPETMRLKYLKKGEVFRLPVTLYRPAKVEGQIRIKGIDSPAVNVQVILEGQRRHAVSTFHDGTYILEDIKPGRYKIRLYHRGFNPPSYKYITLKEGQHVKNINYVLDPKAPEVDLSAYRYTFIPGSKISFNIRTFRLESVEASVYKVPVNVLLEGGHDPDYIKPAKKGFKRLLKWKEAIQNFKPYDWKYQKLEIKKPLASGAYCVEIKAPGGIISRKYFSVTTTGIVVKRSQDSVFVYASNLVTNEPIKNARIAVFDTTPKDKKYVNSYRPYKAPKKFEDFPVKVLMKGNTSKDGIFLKKFTSPKHISVFAVGVDGSYAFSSTGSPAVFNREKNKYFIYTDRPVYRSGDKVFYKFVGKTRQQRFKPLSGNTVYYKIENISRNKTVEEGTISLDEWGTAAGEIKIPEKAGLGVFYIRAGTDKNNMYSYGKFYVEQYRKPEFKVEIDPSKDYFVNGDMTEFRVQAKYFFGSPVKGALIKYRFYETKLNDSSSYWWEDDYSSQRSYNRIKLEGEKYLDENGVAALRLDAGNYPYDREITLEVSVVDDSNVSISSSYKVKVGRGEFYIKLIPEKNFFADDDTKKVTVKTMDYLGRPVSANVNLDLKRYVWKPYQRVYVHEKRSLFSRKISTGSDGTAVISLLKKFNHYGEFDLIASSSDAKGNAIKGSKILWVYSRNGKSVPSKFKNLELEVNKSILRTDEKEITVLLKSRYTDSYVCLTVEGRDIYSSKVVKMTGNIVPVKLKIDPSYAPNFYITATMQRQRALYTRQKNIAIPVKNTEINFEVQTEKEEYKPGDKVKVFITAKDSSGKPVKADLSLSAVDESIYYIRPDHTMKMKDFYYSKISNWVMTVYSYPINVLAGASKGGKVKIRSKFEDTAFWKADIRTNSSGKAVTEFILPDNLTTWRLTARGHDKDGRVGEQKDTFLVTKQLVSRIAKPRFFVEGDKVVLMGIVNNNTRNGVKGIQTQMQYNGNNVTPREKRKLSLSPYGSAATHYAVNIPEGKDSADIVFQAVSSADSDGLQWTVPVYKRGSSYKMTAFGDLNSNSNVEISMLEENDNFYFVPESVEITLNPSPVFQMLKAADYLIDYPYGCMEQTINRFLPVTAIDKLLKKNNLSYLVPDKIQKKLPQMKIAGINKIADMQNSDGTWGWFSGDRGNGFLTAFAMISLYEAKLYGIAVDKGIIERGLQAVGRMLSEKSNIDNEDTRALLFFTYSLYGQYNNSIWQSFVSKEKINPYQAAFILRAAVSLKGNRNGLKYNGFESKRKSMEKTALDYLKQSVKRDSKGIYWQSSVYQRWGWPGARTEITAHVLRALIAVNDKTPLTSQAAASLSARYTGGAWVTTKQTATVISALCEYIDSIGGIQTGPASVSFTIDGNQTVSFNYNPELEQSVDNLTKEIVLNSSEAKNNIMITANGNASKDATFGAVVTGTLYFKPSAINSLFSSEEKGLEKLSNGVAVFRKYSTLNRVKDIHHKEYLMPADMGTKKKISVGEEIMVTVRFRADDNYEYLKIEDFLPSGFEVVKKDIFDTYRPYVHLERWDNRMVYFFKNVEKGRVYELSYIIRAELEGDFMTRPTRVECMYEPSIQGWSSPAKINVSTKGN